MKRIEFWENRQDGPMMVENLDNGVIESFTPESSELIDFILVKIQDDYPEAFAWLKEKFSKQQNGRFLMVLMFLKCNFSENDKRCDIDMDGTMNIEDVHCPLKMQCLLCKAQNIVCNPKLNSIITGREMAYIPYLISGLDSVKIADTMNVSHFTVENTRKKIYRKLGFDGKSAIAQLAVWAAKNHVISS